MRGSQCEHPPKQIKKKGPGVRCLPSPLPRTPQHSLDGPPLPFHQVLDASLKNREEKRGEWGRGGCGDAEEAAARGWPREPGLAGPLRPDGPRSRAPAAGRGVPPCGKAHLSDPPFDDGFGREDPLAHCRQLHLAQRHPQPIILPAPAAGAAPLAHAPQRTGPGGRARGEARARVPAADRHVILEACAPLPGPPPPRGRLLGKVSARGAGARAVS